MPPAAGGGSKCTPRPQNRTTPHETPKYDGWCQEAIDQLALQSAPAACRPSPTRSSVLTTTTTPYGSACARDAVEPFENCTLPLPKFQLYGTPFWNCVSTCTDENYLLIRSAAINASFSDSVSVVQCKGPDMSSCSYFSDPNCTTLVPGQPPPDSINESGALCNVTVPPLWCNIAQRYFHVYPPTIATRYGCNFTRYQCIEACSRAGEAERFINVWLGPEGISCLGNETIGDCIWEKWPSCGNGDYFQYGNAVGPLCTDESTGWCKDAAEVLRYGRSPSCASLTISQTATSSISTTRSVLVAQSTGTPVPSSAGQLHGHSWLGVVILMIKLFYDSFDVYGD